LMRIEEFMEIYGLKKSKVYKEIKKYPWLLTKIGPRMPRIRRSDADKWMEAIKAESNLPV